jgi:hypothetical protein
MNQVVSSGYEMMDQHDRCIASIHAMKMMLWKQTKRSIRSLEASLLEPGITDDKKTEIRSEQDRMNRLEGKFRVWDSPFWYPFCFVKEHEVESMEWYVGF